MCSIVPRVLHTVPTPAPPTPIMSSWSGFRCDHADFTVRSVPAGDEFRVRRECLVQGSDVFRTPRITSTRTDPSVR